MLFTGSFAGQRPLLSFRGAEGDVGISRQAVGGFEISDEPDRTGRLPRLLRRLAMTRLLVGDCRIATLLAITTAVLALRTSNGRPNIFCCTFFFYGI